MSRVKEALDRKGTVVMPGVFDALSARIAHRAGFDVIFTTGYGISATLLGEPDFGILTQTEMLSTIYRICGAVPTPVIVDSDTGYGNAVNVVRTVTELMRAGAAGMFLEDQVWPKRCGHMRGKQVVPLDEYLKKLNAAAAARGDGDLFIVARTDARQALGVDEAIRRGNAFKENGADAVFIEAPESREEMREIARNVPGPAGGQHDRAGDHAVDDAGGARRARLRLDRVARWGRCTPPPWRSRTTTRTCRRRARGRPSWTGCCRSTSFHEIVGLEEKYALDEKYRS